MLPSWRKNKVNRLYEIYMEGSRKVVVGDDFYPELLEDYHNEYSDGVSPYEWLSGMLERNIVPKSLIATYLAKLNGTQFWSDLDLCVLCGLDVEEGETLDKLFTTQMEDALGTTEEGGIRMQVVDTNVLLALPQRKESFGSGVIMPEATEDWLSDRCGKVLAWGENAFRYIRNYPYGPTMMPGDIVAIRPQDIMRFNVYGKKLGVCMDARSLVVLKDVKALREERSLATYDI